MWILRMHKLPVVFMPFLQDFLIYESRRSGNAFIVNPGFENADPVCKTLHLNVPDIFANPSPPPSQSRASSSPSSGSNSTPSTATTDRKKSDTHSKLKSGASSSSTFSWDHSGCECPSVKVKDNCRSSSSSSVNGADSNPLSALTAQMSRLSIGAPAPSFDAQACGIPGSEV